MSNRVKGTIMGILFSLLGIAAWIFLGVVLEVIAGIAGALMGIFFIVGYNKYNKDDKSAYKYIISAIVILVEIILAELLTILILGAIYGVSLPVLLSYPEIVNAALVDVVIGVVLSAFVYVFYIMDLKRKEKFIETAKKEDEDDEDDEVSKPVVENEVEKEVKPIELEKEVQPAKAEKKVKTTKTVKADKEVK